MIKDEFGSNRELCPYIFSNLIPNKNFVLNITGMDIQYDDVKYWKGNDGNLVKENIKSKKIKNDDNIKLSGYI